MFLSERFQCELSDDLWQGGPGSRALCCHGEHGCDPQAHSGGSCVHVDPEGHPGQDDSEKAGNVHLDQVVTHLTFQVEFDLNAGEFTYSTRRGGVKVSRRWGGGSQEADGSPVVTSTCVVVLGAVAEAFLLFQHKLGEHQVVRHLHRSDIQPLENQIVHGVTN